jgi:hypothetical protein
MHNETGTEFIKNWRGTLNLVHFPIGLPLQPWLRKATEENQTLSFHHTIKQRLPTLPHPSYPKPDFLSECVTTSHYNLIGSTDVI